MAARTIIVRSSILPEWYGAYLLENNYPEQYTVHVTEDITEPTEEMRKMKSILIVGAYYNNSLEKFGNDTDISLFLNNGDSLVDIKSLKGNDMKKMLDRLDVSYANEDSGFLATFVLPKLKVDDELHTFITYLDGYMFSRPTENMLCFTNGIYLQEGKNGIEKILNAYQKKTVDEIIETGRQKRIDNLFVARSRYRSGVVKQFQLGLVTVDAFITYGDSPILDTLLYALEESKADVAILVRPNMKLNKTFFTIRSSKKFNAGKIAKKLFGGGGSSICGGASVNGIWKLE